MPRVVIAKMSSRPNVKQLQLQLLRAARQLEDGASDFGLPEASNAQPARINRSISDNDSLVEGHSSSSQLSSGPSTSTPWKPMGSALRLWNVGGSRKGKRSAKSQPSSQKKKKIPTWSHIFVCLASVQQDYLPDSQDREELQLAGLGEKRITMSSFSDAHDIYSELSYHFPKLVSAGGFELLRVPEGGGKHLEVIASPPSGYTVTYLRAVVHHAKVYIRPLQNDLSLDPVADEVIIDPPKEECGKCGKSVPVTSLREHIAGCKRPVQAGQNRRVHGDKKTDPREEENSLDSKSDNSGASVSILSISNDDSSLGIDDHEQVDPVLEVALHLSEQESRSSRQENRNSEPESIADVVRSLRTSICDVPFDMVVSREKIIYYALRRMKKLSFSPDKQLNVIFNNEEGLDTGGLTREFFRLLGYSFKARYLDSAGCFKHDAVAYQDGVYSQLGTLFAMALVHGSGPLRLFSPSVYNYFCGVKPSDIIVGTNEVADTNIGNVLQKVEDVTDSEELREVAMENIDLLLECGFNKPIAKLDSCCEDKIEIIQTISLHKVILCSLAEMSDFCSGLAALGVAEALKRNSLLLRSFFCNDVKDSLTSDQIRRLFTNIVYSEIGSNDRRKEDNAYMHFVDYLDDCERVSGVTREGEEQEDSVESSQPSESTPAQVSLKMVLSFFTGADDIPPLGIQNATLNFNPSYQYPTASTCAIHLTLPTKHINFDEFKKNADIAFTMHGGFGLK